MKEFSVCYDKFCIGRFLLTFDETGNVVAPDRLGEFEIYLLGMWNDGMVVSMKEYDEMADENRFILLMPDGSEQLMCYTPKEGFIVQLYKKAGEGRFAYLLNFLKGMKYKGYQGYEEYDEEEEMIIGVVYMDEKTLTYGGQNMSEVNADFKRVIDKALKEAE